jgi:outer membrane protein assembly factor BamB
MMKRTNIFLAGALIGLAFLLILGYSLLKNPRQDWPTWRYDVGRSAASPQQLPDTLHLLWVREYPKLEQTWDDPLNQDLMQFDKVYEPVIHNGTLFIGSNASDCMIALATDTGEERWRYYVDGPVRFPAVSTQGKVYFVSDDGYLYCLDAASGELIWRFRGAPAGRRILGNERLISTWPARGGPVLQDGVVYFAAGIWPFMGVFVYAVDAETGEVVWKNDSTGSRYMLQPHNSPAYAGVAPQGHLVIAGDKLLVPCGRSVPACFDLKTGKFLYYRLAKNGKTGGAFVAADANFFLNYHRDSVVSLYQVSDGESVIRRLGKVPVMTEDTLFCRGDSITALDLANLRQTAVEDQVVFDRETGSIKTEKESTWVIDPLWRVSVDASGDLIRAGDKLYAGGEGVVSAVSLPAWGDDPELVWQANVEGTVTRIVAADQKLFAVTLEGQVYAFGGKRVESPRFHAVSRERALLDQDVVTRARSILKSTGVTEGYCVVYGAKDGDLVEALLQNSDLRIMLVEPDPDKVEKLRRRFDAEGLHGKRFSVQSKAADALTLPPYLASLVIVENPDIIEGDVREAFFRNVYQGLRPYGGKVYIPVDVDSAPELRKQLMSMELEKAEVRQVEYDRDLVDGVQRAQEQFQSGDLNDDLAIELERASGLLRSEGHLLLTRTGALPGSGDWTHQYGGTANTVKSDDQLVKLPLGVLWFGGSPNTDVLPRHGHGPPEQIIGGRLFIEGMNSLSARDVYTGRILWKREFSRLNTEGVYYDDTYKDTPLDTAYNQVHIPGANARGTNFVATKDRVYLLLDRSCVVLNPETGKTIDEFTLPPLEPGDEPPEWAYIGVYGDYLIGGAEFEDYLEHLDLDELDPRMSSRLNSFYNFDIAASKRLVAMNRYTGDVLWSRKSKLGYWHNAIAVADDTVFCIDRLAPSVSAALKQRPGRYRFAPPELAAFRVKDGRLRWRSNADAFGTWLSYSDEHGLLVQAGRSSRDMLRGEPRGLSVHNARTGSVVWKKDVSDGGPYILHGDTIITESTAYNMLTGEQKMRVDALTGEETPWVFRRDYGCNYIIGSENLLTFRSAAAGFFDLKNDGGTGTFGGFRSSCTSNLIAANGVLNAPDYTRTCSCSYQNQTSLALVHMPELELWTTYYRQPKTVSVAETKAPVLIADPELNLTFGNSAARELFELDEDVEFRQISVADLAADSDVLDEILEGLAQKRAWSGILDIRKADGSSQEVHLMARVLSDESFTPAVTVFMFADSNDSAVAFLDLRGELTYVDDTFLELWLLGDEQEALTRSFDQLWLEKEEAQSVIQDWRRGSDWRGRLTALRGDESTRDVHVITRVVRDGAGSPLSSVINCFDVTERKALEGEISRLVKELGAGVDLESFIGRRPPIKKVGINFGAPGDRKAENGTLWLEWPSNEGPSPEIQLDMLPEDSVLFNHHSSWVQGDGPKWIVSSGVSGVSSLSLWLADQAGASRSSLERLYDVNLYFAEPEDLGPGERLFDVKIQGEGVLSKLDVVQEAGGPRRAVIKTIEGVLVADELKVELTPSAGSHLAEPLISGIEVIARE